MPEAPKDSILNVTKKLLNVPADYDAFDLDLIPHINSTLSKLHQMGVGPRNALEITDAMTPWSEFIDGYGEISLVKSYMGAECRRLFDPPRTSFDQEALNKVISEMEWRLNVASETP